MAVKSQRNTYQPHWSIDDHSKNNRSLLESKNENLESNANSLINIQSANVQLKTLQDQNIDTFIFLTVFICFIFANLMLYREMAFKRLRRNLTIIQDSNNKNRSIDDRMNDEIGRDDNDLEFAYNSGQDVKSNSVFIRNLTKICMKRKNPCWFHPTVFPHSCKRTFCESVEYDVSYDENVAKIRFRPVTSVFEVNNIPDGTPCSPKGWCIKGRCTNVPIEELGRLKNFLEMTKNPEDGGWSNNCDTPKCLINRFDQKHHWNLFLMASKCPGAVCTAYTGQTRRLQFRSCTNPLPGNGGRACDTAETAPITWGPVCQGCPPMFAGEEARKLTSGSILTAVCGRRGKFLDREKCSCSRPNDVPLRFEDGAPCRTFENYTHNSDGFCFFGMCLGYAGYQ
uniref:Uncharacterized protein n=1 Tax=Romanomermis culicivorax TaxID=13658 RepID=A0A915I8T1_ROMCU